MTEFRICPGQVEEEETLNFGDSDDDEEAEMDESRNVVVSSIGEPFEQIKAKMELVHYGIYKQILTEGIGDTVPVNGRVQLDYSSFWEGNTTPFESTFVDRKPCILTMGIGMLPGLYHALTTMKEAEVSQFIIPYTLLYGVLGCGEAIPPKADGFYIIRVIKVEDVGNSNAITDEFIDEYNDYKFVLDRVLVVRKSAKAHYGDGNFELAKRDYKKCVKALKCSTNANREERDNYLAQIYVNLSVCYNKLEQPNKVLEMADQLRFLGKFETNCKALFQLGRAYYKLSDYDLSLEYLAKAAKLEPQNQEVGEEMRMVNQANVAYKAEESQLAKRALQHEEDPAAKKTPEKQGMTASDMESHPIMQTVIIFLADASKTEVPLPFNLSKGELEEIRFIADFHKLDIKTETYGTEVWNFLTKRPGVEYP